LEQAKALGADHCINYITSKDWQNEVLNITKNKGADFILETGGALTLSKSFECVSFGGSIAAIGYLSGKEDATDSKMNTNVLALKRNVTLKGILNGPRDRFEDMYVQPRIKHHDDHIGNHSTNLDGCLQVTLV
jgi:NADPH:quinone reductase-like Zn-dependent oxidoreductase